MTQLVIHGLYGSTWSEKFQRQLKFILLHTSVLFLMMINIITYCTFDVWFELYMISQSTNIAKVSPQTIYLIEANT